MDDSKIEFGIDSFGDRPRDNRGEVVSHAQAIRAAVTEAVLADQVGIDVVALGEHHRPEFAISSPETVLAGIATATKRIRLASGVTVLSSDDPVRVFQRFATVDALSSGRAEVILGRGFVHRVVPAVRVRPEGLRGAVRGEDRPVPPAPGRDAGHVGGHHPGRPE